MEYIDWIISSVIFLMVISFVIITLPQTLNIEDKYTPKIAANTLSYDITRSIEKYEVMANNIDQETYPFRYKLDLENIKSNNPTLEDNGYIYGTVNKNTDIYFNLEDIEINQLGIKVIEESFLNAEFDYFDIAFENSPSTVYDTIYLEADTELTSKKDFSDIIGIIDFMGDSITIKFNYSSDSNSYYECEINNTQQTLRSVIDSVLIDTNVSEIITINPWKKVYFGVNKLNGSAFCYVDTLNKLDYNIDINFGKIIIENPEEINLSKITAYESNDLYSSSTNQKIESNNFLLEVNDSNANISFLKDLEIDYNLLINFNDSLIVPEAKEIAIIKDNTNKEKLAFFSQTKEFWVFNDSEDSLIINLDSDLGLDLDVNFTEDLKLWLDASSLDLNDNDLVGSWTDISGNDNHAIQDNDGNKPVFKENILNGKPAILFNNSALLTENNFSLNDWTIFVLFKDHSTVSTFERILDHSYTNGFWLGRNGSSANSWGGGVKETSVPYGRFISIPDEQWHIIQNIREGTTHKIISGTEEVTGTVTSTTTSENTIAIGSWNSLNVDQRATDMHISEILLFNSALSDSNRLLVENYLSQKYDLDVNSGVNFENKKIELIDLNTNRKKIIIDFFDSNTNLPIDCNYTYKNNKITINSCSNDALIKIRSRDLEVTDYTDYPNINIIKNKERVVFEEYINNLDPNNYFLEIKDQKTIDLKKGREINMENKIYSNYFKYIDNFGNNYLVNLLIKPFNFAIDTNTPDIESGIVTYYDFRDNKSLILKDKITDNDGNIFGSNIIDFYKKENIITNNSGYFNGSDTYVRIPTKDFNGDSGTINIWVKPITITPQTMIFGHQLITNRLYIGFSASSVLSLGVSTAAAINTNAVVLENEWSNLTLTYDSGNYYFYKNGVLTKTGTYTGNIIFQGYADLGWAGNSGWTNKFNGYLGETRIYNRSLDSSEISYLYTKKEKEYR
jgi:hypothetical protein